MRVRNPKSEIRKLEALTFLLPLLLASPLLAATNDANSDMIPPLLPPRGEIPPSLWELHGPGMVVGGFCFLSLVALAIWWLVRPKPQAPAPPEAVARQALTPLREQPETGILLSRVSQVLRRYVAVAFGLSPGELTTSEFCREVAANQKIGPQLAESMRDFLQECDRRKFASPVPLPPLGAAVTASKMIDAAEARLAAAQPTGQSEGSPSDRTPVPGGVT